MFKIKKIDKNIRLLNTDSSIKKKGTYRKIYVPRSFMVLRKFVNVPVYVHRGNTYSRLIPTESMLLHKFGEFVFTRTIQPKHKKKKDDRKVVKSSLAKSMDKVNTIKSKAKSKEVESISIKKRK